MSTSRAWAPHGLPVTGEVPGTRLKVMRRFRAPWASTSGSAV